jgi:hypothetical protein
MNYNNLKRVSKRLQIPKPFLSLVDPTKLKNGFVCQLFFTVYSPDLAPCDYWLNDYIKCRLIDQEDGRSLARAVSKVVKNIPEEEFKKTFEKLLERMELCINNHGDYFEHLIK